MNQRLVLLYRAIIPFTLFFYSFYSLSRPLIVASLTVLIAHLFLNSPFGEKWLREDLVALTDYPSYRLRQTRMSLWQASLLPLHAVND